LRADREEEEEGEQEEERERKRERERDKPYLKERLRAVGHGGAQSLECQVGGWEAEGVRCRLSRKR
jgi:hypothetical protein